MPRSSVAGFASTAPCPSFATMAYAPWWDRMAGVLNLICPTRTAEYFLREGLDRLLVICPSCQFAADVVSCRAGGINRVGAWRYRPLRSRNVRAAAVLRPQSKR